MSSNSWQECKACGEEYQVIGGLGSEISFCPYCGSPVELEEDDYYFNEELED